MAQVTSGLMSDIQSALDSALSGGLGALFRVHELNNNYYFPVCITGANELTTMIRGRYYLFPTKIPEDVATGAEEYGVKEIGPDSSVSEMLDWGRLPIAVLSEPHESLFCDFYRMHPYNGQPVYVLGCFRSCNSQVKIDQAEVHRLQVRLGESMRKLESGADYQTKFQNVWNPEDIIKLVVRLACDLDPDPPFHAGILHVLAHLTSDASAICGVPKFVCPNPLSWTCLLPRIAPQLSNYLKVMVERQLNVPWHQELLEFKEDLDSIALAWARPFVDLIYPRGHTADQRYWLLPRHNQPRCDLGKPLTDSQAKDRIAALSRCTFNQHFTAWGMVKEALLLRPEANDVITVIWIGAAKHNDEAARVLPVGMLVGDQLAAVEAMHFPESVVSVSDCEGLFLETIPKLVHYKVGTVGDTSM